MDRSVGTRWNTVRRRKGRIANPSYVDEYAFGRAGRRGFTLFELLLALLLSTVVLLMISMAIDFHLRVVDAGRTRVEEAQLARAILHRIAEDIRAVVVENPIDVESLVPAGSAGGGGDAGPGGGAREAEALESLEEIDLDALAASGTDDLTGSVDSQAPPGLYGESDWLQVDICRPPRPQQLVSVTQEITDLPAIDALSDIKTVVYRLADSEETALTGSTGLASQSGGLIRSELDRATAAFAAEQGWLTGTEDEEPMAPEVAEIAFQYFDGYEWVESWDSEAMGGLPLAVEIALIVIPFSSSQDEDAAWTSSSELDSEGVAPLEFRLVVHLPAAEATSGGSLSGFEEATSSPSDEFSPTGGSGP